MATSFSTEFQQFDVVVIPMVEVIRRLYVPFSFLGLLDLDKLQELRD